ncbi:MAG: thioredoxin family protein [Alphaproteobacteria bacterium]|nr:thioredoxin family protein [Alphaproteobacteria bacterium]
MLVTTLLATTAHAGGSVSPAPPPPPAADFSTLPATADVQPKNPDGKDHPVHARLIADRTAVAPGETIRVGLHLKQQHEWHTYWKSPGDIGLPTNITWSLPDGATAKPYQYPVPQRFEAEDLVSFGYDDQVLLFSEITIPAGAKPGPATIAATADWLVCKTSCIPGQVELSLPVTIGPGGTPSAFAPLFDHYAAQHPKTPDQVDGIDVRLALSHDAVLPFSPFAAALEVKGDKRVQPDTKRYAFAPIVGDGWMINTRTLGHQGDVFVAKLDAETLLDEPPATPDRIGGLFLLEVDGKPVAIEVEHVLPWKPAGAEATATDDPLLKTPITALEIPNTGHEKVEGAPELGSFDTPPVANASMAASDGALGALGNLLFAFFGGLLLNIMPCVLPVLTLKLYSLVEQSDITAAEQRTAGAAYTGGILASFWALAAAIIGLRAAFGMEVDWGFQFQYPPYVAALATIVFAFGLSLFGVFEIPAMGVSTASAAGAKEGVVGYFFTGVFATLLATPCSAPFLGTAIAFALGASTPMLFGIFTLVGLGLAAPFLLIAFVPALYRLLPRPGAWMETFKQLLGFTLVATAIWLVGVLGSQIGLDRLQGFLVFLMFVSAGCWVFGHFGGVAASGRRQLVSAGVGAVIALMGGWGFLDLAFADEPVVDDGTVKTQLDFSEHIPWQPFSEQRLAQLEGTPVFVDFTAEWCLTCKVNEKTILETSAVRAAMSDNGVVPLKADWTRRDQTITDWLHRYGKAGVPFYLVIPAKGDPIPLGEVITPGGVIAALEKSAG